MRAQELAVEVAGAVGDDIRDRYLSREDLLTAPVPSLRGNHAGNLVDGVLPNTGGGYVGLERRGGAAPALGDLNGDGRGDAVAVITSSAGAGGLRVYEASGGADQGGSIRPSPSHKGRLSRLR